MEEKFKCPRCGFEQSPTEDCRKCRVKIPKYLDLQKRRRAVPDGGTQRRRAEDDQQTSEETPPKEDREVPVDKLKPIVKDTTNEKPQGISLNSEKFENKDGLTGVGELFDRTWDIYKRRAGTLIALYLLFIVFMIIPISVFVGIGFLFSKALPDIRVPLIAAGAVVGIIAGIITGFWGFGSFIFAVTDENLGIKGAFEKGWQKVWPFIWLFLLLFHIVTGGFLLFFIPGVIFIIWFAFAQFILARDDVKGMNALLKSKEYVKGYWFDVFVRLFVVWLISVGISMIPIIGIVLSILFVPFEMIFIYLIYLDLIAIKGDVAYLSSTGEKFKWVALGTLGYVVIPLIIIAIMGAALLNSLIFLKGMLK
ncbi:MAG: hypothetical protein A2Y97_06110 [Nitrospirae bacterium RBG_13_39_12]|nr:MAG: hypothetical protein A2Y97_06110 [Nitrospirae bacterium RBG_13_39_12]